MNIFFDKNVAMDKVIEVLESRKNGVLATFCHAGTSPTFLGYLPLVRIRS